MGEIFNDIVPRNIGASNLIFDPALHPIHTIAIAVGGYLVGREIDVGVEKAYE
jgi:hypothetical protein